MNVEIYDSQNSRAPEFQELFDLWRYRALLVQLIRRNLVTRYKRSVLGVMWTMLHPLGMMVIQAIVFSHLFHAMRSYPAYLLTGLVPWGFFTYTTTNSMSNLLWGGSLLGRIYMPPTSFVLATTGTALVNLLISLVPMFGVLLATRVPPHWPAITLPISILLLTLFSLGFAMLLSSLAVFFYDVAEMYGLILSAWYFLTPIFYPENMLSHTKYSWILTINPMHHFVRLFRLSLYHSSWPAWSDYFPAIIWAVSLTALGWAVYTRKSKEFAYLV